MSADSLDSILCGEEVTKRDAAFADGFDTVASLVGTGLGIGLFPEGCAAQYGGGNDFTILRLDDDWAERQWNICFQDGAPLAPPVRLLLDHLTQGAR